MIKMLKKFSNLTLSNFLVVLFFNLSFLVANDVSISLGNLDTNNQTVDILYDFDSDVASFQFDVSGLSGLSYSGGDAVDNGINFITVGSNGTIVGYSFPISTIPAGSGTLLSLSYSGITADEACLSMGLGTITDSSGND